MVKKILSISYLAGWSTALLLAGSCANFQKQDSLNLGSTSSQGPGSVTKTYRVTDASPPEIKVPALPDIPVEMHPLVDQWVRYFQGRGRHHMERYLARSSRYGDLMKRILRENGMPDDLLYIALIESGFSSRAVSHASAVGYWQFIAPTGRRYNLEITTLVDDRRDPVLSTQAAAAYFRDLYGMFDSWYLAMAGYNAGENRIKRLVSRHKTRDFWELASKRRALPRETKHYVPKYIAANLIAKNPAEYGFSDIEYEPPLEFEMIQVEHPVDIHQMAKNLNMDYDELKVLNPKFKGPLAPLSKLNTLELRVPIGQGAAGLVAATNAKADATMIANYRSDDIITYRVRRGDTLSGIAARHRTTIRVLRDMNNLKPNRILRVGQRLDLPKRTGAASVISRSTSNRKSRPQVSVAQSDVAANTQASTDAKPKHHVVQRGDTLIGIAEEYEVTVGELVRLNNLRRRAILPVGLRLKLPVVEPLPTAVAEREGDRRSPSSTRVAAHQIHVVRRGENLQLIARRYNLSVQTLIAENNLRNPSMLRVGQRIRIPGEVSGGSGRSFSSQPTTHIVRRGENLQIIAKRYKMTVQRIISENNLRNPSMIRVGQRLRIPGDAAGQSTYKSAPVIHVIRRGENVQKIADRYNVPMQKIINKNNLRNPSRIQAGKKLHIPGRSVARHSPVIHVVRRGENLQAIAQRYNLPIRKIVRKNRLSNPSQILAGQKLLIPGI